MSKRIISAIDVGSFKISTVVVAVDTEDKIPQVIGVCSQPSVGVKKGVIINIDDAVNSISSSLTAAERMAGITIPSVYVSVNGKDIQSLNNKGVVAISRQDIGPEDVLRAIESAKTIPLAQDKEIVHVISREFIVDSQGGIKYPLGMSGNRLEVDTHIVVSPTTVVQNLIRAVQHTGLGIDGIVFSGLASSLSVVTETEKELGVLLLDIGAGTVSISLYLEGAVSYSGVVPFGGMHVTSDLAAGLQISFEEAERLKRSLGELLKSKETEIESEDLENDTRTALERNSGEDKKTSKVSKKKNSDNLSVSSIGISTVDEVSRSFCVDIINARLQEIISLVKSQIEKSGVPLAIPAGVIVTGGGAKTYGIADIVKKTFGVTCRIGKPSGLHGMTDEINDTEFSVVQGLIKYAVVEDVDVGGSRGRNPASPFIDKVKEFITKFFPKSN